MKVCAFNINQIKTVKPCFKGHPSVNNLLHEGDVFTSYHEMMSVKSKRWYDQNKEIVKKIVETPDGKITIPTPNNPNASYAFDEIFTPYKKPLGIITHGTTSYDCLKIKKEGFAIKPKSWVESIRGIYFTLEKDANNYGSDKINAKFHGNVFEADTDKILTLKYHANLTKYLQNLGISNDVSCEEIMLSYLKEKMEEKGVDGFVSKKVSTFANCKYFVTDKTNLLEIID